MQKRFLLNVMLTLIWMALTGTFSYINLFIGFVLSHFILWVISRKNEDKRYLLPDRINTLSHGDHRIKDV